MMEKLKEMEVNIELNPEGYHRKGFRNWHKYAKYSIGKDEIIISDSLGGCGIQHLYGWYANPSTFRSKEIEILIKKVVNTLHQGVGLVTCQVGSAFLNSKLTKALDENGFTYIEYSNYQHDSKSNEKGRLYTLTVKHEKD